MPRASLAAVATLALALGACSPGVDLGDDRARRFVDAGVAVADGSLIVLAGPPAGIVAPTNLAAIVLEVAAPFGAPPSFHLRGVNGGVTALGSPTPVPCAGTCYQLALASPLPPSTAHQLELSSGTQLEDGRAQGPGRLGSVTTGSERDDRAPRITDLRVEPSAGCVRVRLRSDESGQLLLAEGVGRIVGQEAIDAVFRPALGPLPVEIAFNVALVDWAGNRGQAPPAPIRLPPRPPPLVITEVLANPAGSDTTQEFVELRNIGAEPLSLAGFAIEDAGAGDPLPAVILPRGGFAVVVGAGYDAGDGRDPAPRAGAHLVPVPGRIGHDGLTNAGETVRLRRGGDVISQYGGWVDTNATGWRGRSVQRVTDDACDHPTSWNDRPLAPTPGW